MSNPDKTPTIDTVMEAWQRDANPPTWAQIVAMKQEHAELRETAARQASLLRGCYARINGLEKAVNDAIPAMREYARKNPKHYWNDAQQDPNGAHAWLAKNDGAALTRMESKE